MLGERGAAEVVALRAGGEDEVVVRDRAMVGQQAAAVEINPRDRSQEKVRVAQRADELADRSSDLTRVEQRRRDLVEQRREEVVVVPVDEQHLHRGVLQRPRARQTAKAGARDHDSRALAHCLA